MKQVLAFLLAFLLAACGGGGSSDSSLPSRWQVADPIPGVCCNYAALVQTPTGLRSYTNSAADGTPGDLNLYENGAARTVLHIDDPRDTFIRTLAVVERGGKYFALLYTGDGYPTQGGYSPSWATSDDGVAWTWHGPVSPYGRNQSSAGALVADDDGFRAWVDLNGILHEMHSADGLHWLDAGIVTVPGSAQFATAARTPTGTMLAAADTWPSNSIATLWQCNGKEWAVLEEKSAIHFGEKGTTLAYFGGLIHAYSNGSHWTTTQPSC